MEKTSVFNDITISVRSRAWRTLEFQCSVQSARKLINAEMHFPIYTQTKEEENKNSTKRKQQH